MVLMDVSEARRRLVERFLPLEGEALPLSECLGRVLAADVMAPYDVPLFPNSSMDGFAVRSQDIERASPDNPVVLRVVQDIPAGVPPEKEVLPGEAARIMTGAALPEGADCVVPVEDTDCNYRDAFAPLPSRVRIYRPAKKGENVRPRGQDVQRGERVLSAGHRLRPQDLGFLGMLGLNEVPVRRKPRVAIFSCGNELVSPGKPLGASQIYDANSYTLSALVAKYGAQTISLGIARDDYHQVIEVLEQAVEQKADLIVSSAGVSVGAFDLVRSVLEKEGRLEFWRVNMRPGKPLAFGYYRNVPLVGLPGNPVSAFVGFEVFVRPAILKMLGILDSAWTFWRARLEESVESDGRESYLRAVVSWAGEELRVRLSGHQGSGNLRSLVRANALLFLPSGVKSLPPGSQVQVILLE